MGVRDMKLGAFSISLAVRDLTVSRAFYEKLGFSVFAGDADTHYLIMRHGDHLIGLFQGMFENNILTFNPGWDQQANKLESFDDVREIKQRLQAKGIEVLQEQGGDAGPGSFVVIDPDGNPILIDQHVD
jgi:catechol 2,3-dioxygenase-like lactoylglutathione lyase family enzyme